VRIQDIRSGKDMSDKSHKPLLKLDDTDKEILRVLQEDCTLSLKEIRKKVEGKLDKRVPTTTIHSKIYQMEKDGFILCRKAILNAKLLDQGVTAYIFLSYAKIPKATRGMSARKIIEQLEGLPGVQEIHILAGERDILVKVKSRNVESLARTVWDQIREINGISQSTTAIVFRTHKEDTQLDI